MVEQGRTKWRTKKAFIVSVMFCNELDHIVPGNVEGTAGYSRVGDEGIYCILVKFFAMTWTLLYCTGG